MEIKPLTNPFRTYRKRNEKQLDTDLQELVNQLNQRLKQLEEAITALESP